MHDFFSGLVLGGTLMIFVIIALMTSEGGPYSIREEKIKQCEAELSRDKHCVLIAMEREI